MQRFGKWFFLLLIAFHLLYIWQQKYFLTSDGPAHVHNAKVLLNMLCGKSVAFYQQYYDFNLNLSTNRFAHILLMPLMLLFNPVTAEKILLSIYVLLFPISFWFAVKQMAGKVTLPVILVFPFIFHFLLCYGFYNYSFSIVFALFLIGSWRKLRDESMFRQAIVLFPLSFLVFVTHIFGWFIAAIILAGIFLIELIPVLRQASFSNAVKGLLQKWLVVFVAGLISVGAVFLFMQQNSAELQYWPEKPERLQEIFIRLEALVLWGTDREFLLIQLFAGLIFLLTVIAFIKRIYCKEPIVPADAWLLSAVIFIFIYFLQPKALFLGGFWPGRMSWLGWLFLVAWLSSFSLPVYVERTTACMAVVLMVLLAAERFPFQQKTSDALADYLSAVEKIPAQSTVLPLSFSHYGIDEKGNRINNYRRQFQHAFDYCGAYKPIINYANYEAATTWFPLHWKQDCNPYEKFGRGMGIEYDSPDALLNPLDTSACHFNIDYVVTWCMAFSNTTTAQWISINWQLKESYLPVYESPTKRTKVWKRKTF